jgi:hypothetical protein
MIDATIAMIPGCILISAVGFYMGRRSPQLRGWFFLIYFMSAMLVALITLLFRRLFGLLGPAQAYQGFVTFLVWGIAAEVGARKARARSGQDVNGQQPTLGTNVRDVLSERHNGRNLNRP